MAAFIQVPADGVGKRVDTVTLTDATVEVHRQKMVVTGGSGTAEVVVVTNANPAAGDMGLVVRVAGSANVAVTGTVSLGPGTSNIGTLNNVSATVTVAVMSIFTNAAVPSASRGPRMILASTSANVTLIAAPGANMAIYITQLAVSNASGTNTRTRIGTSASIGQVTMMVAQSGGGFVMQFKPPWQMSTNEAAVCSVKPNVSEGIFNVNYFIASAGAI